LPDGITVTGESERTLTDPPICILAVTDRHCCPWRTQPGFGAGLLRVESAAAGGRTGVVVPELLIAGSGLPDAMFPGGVRCVTRRGATGLEPERC
jgi:hypothetical protein